jgi:tripartite ATP-independent transporter DctP family solute receptor
MRRFVACIAATLVGGIAAAQAQTEIKFGHVGEPGSLFQLSADEFAERANAKLEEQGLDYKVVVFGSSQLGTDEELLQKLLLGTADIALPSTVMSSVVPEFGLFEMPYLVKDRDHMHKIEQEVVWPTLAPAAEEAGYEVLAVWENGFRNITNNVRPIKTPEDLSGIKLRTPSGEWRVKMFQAYGANPTPMSFSEVFTALQTGVVDGQENPLSQISSAKLHEVQDYLSMTGHVYTPAYVLVGQNRWNSFPEEVRQVLEETAKDTQAFVYENGERLDSELLDQIQAESDIEVNEPDKDAFIAASDSIYEEFGNQVEGGKEMIDKAISLGGGS